jgi:hypothetical protein
MSVLSKSFCAASICALLGAAAAAHADETSPVRNGRIGYAQTALHWAVYQTPDGKTECPQGLNGNGPREIFAQLYPKGGSTVGTELTREGLKVFPADHAAQFPYLETQGNIALGLNLDGKVGPKDFTNPDGEKGIDNAFYRVIGCNAQFRGPEGQLQLFANKETRSGFDRMMIEVTGVDSLENDPSVEVTIYRGREPLVLDATGEGVAPGGTQRIDDRYGKRLIQQLHGKIENGILTTEPIKEAIWTWQIFSTVPRSLHIRDMRLRLKVSPTHADGLMAGYFTVDSLYNWITSWSTHHLAYGRLDAPEFYWEIRRNADAYPDAKGQNTAISSAITLNMSQVFIEHPESTTSKQVASGTSASSQHPAGR